MADGTSILAQESGLAGQALITFFYLPDLTDYALITF